MKLSINIDGADDVELLDVDAEEAPGMSLAALRGKIGKSPRGQAQGGLEFRQHRRPGRYPANCSQRRSHRARVIGRRQSGDELAIIIDMAAGAAG